MSKILSRSAVKALNRLGDIMCPRNGEFPSYSELGAVEHVDMMIELAPAQDIKDLNMLLSVLAYMPTFVLKWLVRTMVASYTKGTGGFYTLMRQLDFGLKGIINGTYYSGRVGKNFTGKAPLDIIGFKLNRLTD